MRVCEYCLQAIQSREGYFIAVGGQYVDETDPTESRCEWCEETANSVLYDI